MIEVTGPFLNEMQGVFGPLPIDPIPDGEIHRFQIPGDKPGSRNGWYVLYGDGLPAGAFGSWKLGNSFNWSARGGFDAAEQEAFQRRLEDARRRRAKALEGRQTQAATIALDTWKRARPASNSHPYLLSKMMPQLNLRQLGATLLVPLVDINFTLVNLQRISPQGGKRFLPNGRVSGCFSPIGRINPNGELFICEGWATGAAIYQATGIPVACAMNCGNLKAVAQALRNKFPGVAITVAGDDDRNTPGNPGRTKAVQAAALTRSQLVFPAGYCRPDCDCTDFNDLYCCGQRAGAGGLQA